MVDCGPQLLSRRSKVNVPTRVIFSSRVKPLIVIRVIKEKWIQKQHRWKKKLIKLLYYILCVRLRHTISRRKVSRVSTNWAECERGRLQSTVGDVTGRSANRLCVCGGGRDILAAV